MSPNRSPAINRLLRGISADHVTTVRDAWRELCEAGPVAVPIVCEKLAAVTWHDPPRGPSNKFLGVLLALLDELDPDAFEEEVVRLRDSPLHPVHRQTVEVLAMRCSDQPAAHVGPDIPVFVTSEIVEQSVVIANISRWSRTRGLQLEDVTRIDVIADSPHLDYLGLYNLFFSGIILTWPTDPARGLRLWWRCLRTEFTFYHEVGHHACGHVEGGAVAEHEEEANDYARRMMQRSRPLLIGAVRVFLLPIRPLLRMVVAKVKRGRHAARVL